ncbi:hypothetical protein L228DRAFT_243448 [Xylona heveae TC161]|uniref:PinX1-related protein 1 n=1 Tax=Xylona heveae (strain CBS 132557 / TC161) TaxID=1328760 RepID=A0A165K288_XYLHT|nr:hypothetical protein L228DRAFT_243448 [Xylona heveae TC161]KZF26904.1 hypothetical protein L228DRAFT_243448 [Xylona heveae TC161]
MGLSGPRKRTKFSYDPNNTAWARSTETFGHKMLTRHGWQPGQLLGATNAPHAEFHTSANASHIRVTLKDDTLGLGAKRGSGQGAGECTGLDVFQGLLGRLNGKSDGELEKEEKSRADLKRVLYAERRWGLIQFVRGGLLVGDKIENPSEEITKAPESRAAAEKGVSTGEVEMRDGDKESQERRDSSDSDIKDSRDKDKKKRKEKKKKKSKSSDEDNGSTRSGEREEKRKRKMERRAKKEAKRIKRQQRASRETTGSDVEMSSSSDQLNKGDNESVVTSREASKAPQSSMSQQPISFAAGRHAVRQRYIRQKKMASMDSRALNEIFMVKA